MTGKTANEMAEAATAHKVFRLFDLPDEIWVQIGKAAVDDAPSFTTDAFVEHTDPNRMRFKRDPRVFGAIPPAIVQTCKKLRYELLPYYYSTKIDFTMGMARSQDKHSEHWLRAISLVNRKLITGIKLFQMWEDELGPREYLEGIWRFDTFELVESRVDRGFAGFIEYDVKLF